MQEMSNSPCLQHCWIGRSHTIQQVPCMHTQLATGATKQQYCQPVTRGGLVPQDVFQTHTRW